MSLSPLESSLARQLERNFLQRSRMGRKVFGGARVGDSGRPIYVWGKEEVVHSRMEAMASVTCCWV